MRSFIGLGLHQGAGSRAGAVAETGQSGERNNSRRPLHILVPLAAWYLNKGLLQIYYEKNIMYSAVTYLNSALESDPN